MADRALPILAPRYRSYKDDGTVNASGKIYFYEAGTTTPKDTYQNAEATIANANPVILNSRGEAAIYGQGAYKIIEKDSDDNQLGAAMDGVLLPEITDDALALLDDATVAAMRTSLGLGTAAILNVGTSASNILQLNASARIPGVDGSLLTNLGVISYSTPLYYFRGLAVTRVSATTFNVAVGYCTNTTTTPPLIDMIFTPAQTKNLGAWAEGTGVGSLDTGAIDTDSWYFVYLISQAAGANPDVTISLAGPTTGPAMPDATWLYYRLIGSLFTDGSAQLIVF